jgi:ferredoxin-like protein FixX
MNRPLAILFSFLFFTGLASAGAETSINQQLQQGGTVHLPAGTYVLTDSIVMQSGSCLEGEPGTVITIQDNAGWIQWKPLISGIGVQNVTIKGIEFDGNDLKQDNTPTWSGHDGKGSGKRWGQGYFNFIHVIDCDFIDVNNCLRCTIP